MPGTSLALVVHHLSVQWKTWRNNSLKNKTSVIIYFPLCCSNPVWLSSSKHKRQNVVTGRMWRLTAAVTIHFSLCGKMMPWKWMVTAAVILPNISCCVPWKKAKRVNNDRIFIFRCTIPLRTQHFHPIFPLVNNTLIPVFRTCFAWYNHQMLLIFRRTEKHKVHHVFPHYTCFLQSTQDFCLWIISWLLKPEQRARLSGPCLYRDTVVLNNLGEKNIFLFFW